MSEQPMEQIPHRYVVDELQAQLNSRTAELVMAMARIRTRDETIASLREQLAAATYRNEQKNEPEAP